MNILVTRCLVGAFLAFTSLSLQAARVTKNQLYVNNEIFDESLSCYGGAIQNNSVMILKDPTILNPCSVTNSVTGTIMAIGYIEAYPLPEVTTTNTSTLTNSGTVLVPELAYYAEQSGYFTWNFRGKMVNLPSGSFLIRRSNVPNLVPPGAAGLGIPPQNIAPDIENSGYFQISSGSTWDASEAVSGGRYTQTGGELRVDGTLGSSEFLLKSGVVSGNGTIKGRFNPPQYFNKNITFSPGGAPGSIGTLKINSTTTDLVACTQCTIDIDLSSNTSYDQLQITANTFYMINPTINIRFVNNFVPRSGTKFRIVTASNFPYFESGMIILPDMATAGVRFDIQKEGNSLMLIVSDAE